ncbi:hypothetical protein CEXT_696481 [Caerostris extrusa]|uniref:Uncharacterized protein n=1 Tax=Caerostris extrusa TaxID=172846 RepID=A0AAV4XXJ9_CAEEX|nr:hypothetical protein CEXT_696481 [Caerostris extrusa]
MNYWEGTRTSISNSGEALIIEGTAVFVTTCQKRSDTKFQYLQGTFRITPTGHHNELLGRNTPQSATLGSIDNRGQLLYL